MTTDLSFDFFPPRVAVLTVLEALLAVSASFLINM